MSFGHKSRKLITVLIIRMYTQFEIDEVSYMGCSMLSLLRLEVVRRGVKFKMNLSIYWLKATGAPNNELMM